MKDVITLRSGAKKRITELFAYKCFYSCDGSGQIKMMIFNYYYYHLLFVVSDVSDVFSDEQKSLPANVPQMTWDWNLRQPQKN